MDTDSFVKLLLVILVTVPALQAAWGFSHHMV